MSVHLKPCLGLSLNVSPLSTIGQDIGDTRDMYIHTLQKSLERYLGEAQKKHFKHTNARYSTEDQLDARNLRTWQLRDLLHVAGSTLFETQISYTTLTQISIHNSKK